MSARWIHNGCFRDRLSALLRTHWVLAAAIDGRADLLVTWDQDLLAIANQAPLPIVDPRGCLGSPPPVVIPPRRNERGVKVSIFVFRVEISLYAQRDPILGSLLIQA